MSLLRALRFLVQLTPRDMVLHAEAQLAVIAAQRDMGRKPVGQLIATAPMRPTAVGLLPSDWRTALEIGEVVSRIGRYGLTRPQCLVRSLALQRMLVRRNIGSDLRIGTRFASGALEAHAWVELGGRVVGDAAQHVETFSPVTHGRLVQL